MELGFSDFGILVYPDEGFPIFAVRSAQTVKERYIPANRFGAGDLYDHIRRMELMKGADSIIPLFINPRPPAGDWKCVTYQFGKTKIAGYYR